MGWMQDGKRCQYCKALEAEMLKADTIAAESKLQNERLAAEVERERDSALKENARLKYEYERMDLIWRDYAFQKDQRIAQLTGKHANLEAEVALLRKTIASMQEDAKTLF